MGSKAGKGVSPGQSKAMTGATIGPGSISGADERVVQNIERIASNAARRNKPEFRNLTPEMVDSFQQRNPRRYGNPSQPLPSYTLANAPGGKPLLSNAPGGFPYPINLLPPSFLNPEQLETYPGYIKKDPTLPNTPPPGLEPYFEENNDVPPSLRMDEIPTQNLPGGQIDQRNINPRFPVLRPGDLNIPPTFPVLRPGDPGFPLEDDTSSIIDQIRNTLKNVPSDLFPKGNLEEIIANSTSQGEYNRDASEDLVNNVNLGPFNLAKEIMAPGTAAALSLPYDAMQAYQRMEDGSGLAGYGNAFMAENPFSSLVERSIGAATPLANRLSGILNSLL